MRLAYFSPFPPQKSGIADYSEYLVSYLSKHAHVDLWVDNIEVSNIITSKYNIFNYVEDPTLLENLNEYDSIIYNIGNNPYYHTNMYDVFLRYNGFVILHDFVLYYLITGYCLDYYSSKEMYLREFYYNYGNQGIASGTEILKSSTPPLRYSSPESFPLNKRLIEQAKGIFVHSNYTKKLIMEVNAEASCKVIDQIGPTITSKLSNENIRNLREKYGVKENELILASFGFVSESKRVHQVIKALNSINCSNYKYILVGEGDYIDKYLDKYPKVKSQVIKTGFTTIEEFDNLIEISDIVINLRYPYMGETSASLIRALIFGKPSIVSDIGWFSELPDRAVKKIPVDNNEVSNLKECISELIHNVSVRSELASQAEKYAEENLNPNKIANDIIEYMLLVLEKEKEIDFAFKYCDKISAKLLDFGIEENDERIIDHYSQTLLDILNIRK
ncbi:glycosyltransferase family 4 protein [Paenibacillus sp. USDA918EY]|uniref:glycosyltransferase family 4 protein n=1 Tax=Paenibacillus sp. USDA918EY TaxID=2689575 RepID=UPI0013596B60|nr:glycosyltransferase family 4 protein [Paenibacillus sp. USDA918EY]